MKKYIILQSKRTLRYIPGALCVVLVILLGLLMAYSAMMQTNEQSENNQKISVAIAGSNDDPLIDMALSAVAAFDSSRFSMDISLMESEQAKQALRSGKIQAYVDVPEGFIDNAMSGKIIPLKLVTTAGSSGLINIFRDEITDVISEVLLSAQNGVYGLNTAMHANGYSSTERVEQMNALNMRYVNCVLTRDGVYTVEELGVGNGLAFADYLICGLMTLLLLLACLPFAPLMIRQDHSLGRMLASKGRGATMQAVADFGCYFVWLMLMLVGVISVTVLCMSGNEASVFARITATDMMYLLPVLLLVTSMSYMLYSLASDLIGGVLLQFFVTVALCFVSGCMYPVFFFPESVQRLATVLPTGVARTVLSGCITDSVDTTALLLLLGYSVAFIAIGVLLHVRRIRWERK